jgi:hypothetical protein
LIGERGYIKPLNNVTVVEVDTEETGKEDEEKDGIRERETNRDAGTGQTPKGKMSDVRPETPPELAELFRLEIPLENDRVMYVYGPRRILRKDKAWIKDYINLWLEERPSGGKPADERSSTVGAGKPADERESAASGPRDVERKDH